MQTRKSIRMKFRIMWADWMWDGEGKEEVWDNSQAYVIDGQGHDGVIYRIRS
jgi:hypothetical protein